MNKLHCIYQRKRLYRLEIWKFLEFMSVANAPSPGQDEWQMHYPSGTEKWQIPHPIPGGPSGIHLILPLLKTMGRLEPPRKQANYMSFER